MLGAVVLGAEAPTGHLFAGVQTGEARAGVDPGDGRKEAQEWLEKAQSSRRKKPNTALEFLKKAIDTDDKGGSVRLQALRIQAELYSRRKQHKKSRLSYQQHFDEAQEITTIHSGILRNIARLSQQYGTAYLNAEDVFYHHSPDGITANELFWDELHPSNKGHQYLSKAIYPWVKDLMEQE